MNTIKQKQATNNSQAQSGRAKIVNTVQQLSVGENSVAAENRPSTTQTQQMKKKRTEITIETRRQINPTQSQPLFRSKVSNSTKNSISTKGSVAIVRTSAVNNKENSSKVAVLPKAVAGNEKPQPGAQTTRSTTQALNDLLLTGQQPKGASPKNNVQQRNKNQVNMPADLPRPKTILHQNAFAAKPTKNQTLFKNSIVQQQKSQQQMQQQQTLADTQQQFKTTSKTQQTGVFQYEETEDDQATEQAKFVSKKNPHKIVREMQKKDRLFMFAAYDYLADPAVFRQVLQKLPTQRTFPQEMCQLIIKDFELCFGKVQPEIGDHGDYSGQRRGNGAHEYLNPDESSVPEEAPEIKPFAKKSKNKVLFVQAYLLPLVQLLELITFLTEVNPHDLKIPTKFSFKQPLKLETPKSQFYNSLTKLSPFETLDVLCLTRDESNFKNRACSDGVIPPKNLVRTLFQTYTNVFNINQTQHTLLYYLYQMEQIKTHYRIYDMVQVVALDLLRQAHCLKQEEPTIMDHGNQTQLPEEPNQVDYERIDSPQPHEAKKNSQGAPFRISLFQMPLDPGSPDKNNKNDYNSPSLMDRKATQPLHSRSKPNLNHSYLESNQKSRASVQLHGQSREQVQEVLSMASEKNFGLGGKIITGMTKPGLGGGMGSFSRNSLTQSGMNTIQSDLTAFGNCPFNASNLSLSVYGNNSILGGDKGRNAYAMMNNLNQASPKKVALHTDQQQQYSQSPYYGSRPSIENQQPNNRRFTK